MFLNILMGISLFTVLVTLILGMVNLLKTDEASQIKANKLMRVRVISQAVAIGVLFIAMTIKKNGA